MVDNIKQLWTQVNHKTQFIEFASKELDRSPLTMRVHWFAQFWSIPNDKQQRVVELLQNWIKQQ